MILMATSFTWQNICVGRKCTSESFVEVLHMWLSHVKCFHNWLLWHRTHRGLLAQKSLEKFKNRKLWSHPPYYTLSVPENIFPPPYFLLLPQGPDTYHLEFWVSFADCWESWIWQKCNTLYSSSDIMRITFICIQHSCYFIYAPKR